MRKISVISGFVIGLSICNIANAKEKNTLSVGYAQSYAKIYDSNEDARGINLKYHHELDNVIGVMGSFTYTEENFNRYNSLIRGDINYLSLLAGPSFKINDYISAYALAGLARGKSVIDVRSSSKNIAVHYDNRKTSLSGSIGFQMNPMPNWIIDTSLEYARVMGTNVKTWSVGLGYRF